MPTTECRGKLVIMTYREFYLAVSNANVDNELVEFSKMAIAKPDEKNEKRKSSPSKVAIANEPIKASIVELLANGEMVASDIAVALEISTQKASALCRQLVENGKLISTEIKVPKKGKVKAYSLAVGE